MSDNKLLQFKAQVKDEMKEFVFYGDYKETEIKTLAEGKNFPTIEEDVDNLRLMEIKNGKEVPYEVTSRAWTGYQYDETDAFHQTWTSLTVGSVTDYKFSYIDPGIQQIVDTYKEEVVEIEDGTFCQKYGVYQEPDNLVSVAAVTKEEIYYVNYLGEQAIDIWRETGKVLSDNYFAENSLFELIEDAKEGKEKLLFVAMEYGVPNTQEKRPDKIVDSKDKGMNKSKEKMKKSSVLNKLHEKQEKIKGTEKKAPQKKHEQEL